MLLESSQADAYGIAFEFCENTQDRPNDLARYYQHPRYQELKPGQYSDDTARSIANAWVLLRNQQFSLHAYIDSYLTIQTLDPRMGYSKRYQGFIDGIIKNKSIVAPVDYFRKNVVRRAASNGSIMGVSVLGYLPNPTDVSLAASIQALTTHSHETIVYAQAIALMAHWNIYNGIGDIDEFVLTHITGGDLVNWKTPVERVDMSAKNTYRAVRRLLEYPSLRDIIYNAVNMGGDTDSIASIAVSIASAGDRYVRNIPSVLFDGLENFTYGRDYLITLDQNLREKFIQG